MVKLFGKEVKKENEIAPSMQIDGPVLQGDEFKKQQIDLARSGVKISDARLKQIREYLLADYVDLLNESLLDEGKRSELKKIVLEQPLIEGTSEEREQLAQYVVEELVGLGEFQKMINVPFVTDISYDGKDTHIKTNKGSFKWPIQLSNDYVETVVTKIANATGGVFTYQNPIIDDQIGNIRVNAIHDRLATTGVTLSLRISRFGLVLTEDNFHIAAPMEVSDLLKGLIKTRINMVSIGKTGSGKTETLKYLLEAIPDNDKVFIIEDIPEMRMRELYPNKHVVSVQSSVSKSKDAESFEIKDLLRPALRSNPKWIIVTETRGAEIYQLIQAMQTGHNSVTSLHVDTLRGVPNRVVSMVTEEYPNASEGRIEKMTLDALDIGIHMMEKNVEGKTIRYIREIVEYDQDDGITTLFEQKFFGKERHITKLSELSPKLLDRIKEEGVDIQWPGSLSLGKHDVLDTGDKITEADKIMMSGGSGHGKE